MSLSSLFRRYNKAKGILGKKRGFLFQLDVLAYSSVPEKIPDLSESPDIFVLMCARLPGPERYVW